MPESICKKKKIRAVQFTNCTTLSTATLCQSHLQEKKLGRCNLQIAPPYLLPLYVRVICKKKKKLGRCNLQSDVTLCQSHLQEKKIGQCDLQIALPCRFYYITWSFCKKKKFGVVQFTNCTAQCGRAVHAPPFQVQFSDIRSEVGTHSCKLKA